MLPLSLSLACGPSNPTAPPPVVSSTAWDPDAPLADRCFDGIGDGSVPQYDAFGPVVPRDCMGTDHQDITALDRLVFVGDSVTAGTPPTPASGVYRALLSESLGEVFGTLEVADCSRWGARADDLVRDDDQLVECLGTGVDPRATLVVFTIGGNDLMAISERLMDGASSEEVQPEIDEVIATFAGALDWLVDARARFPSGLYVVFGDVYEYTDGTGDLASCPAAELLGFAGEVPEARAAAIQVNEAWVRLATERGFDVAFLLEWFCGHGFYADDPTNECWRGPGTERWFDDSCIHPNPAGHAQIAEMFHTIVTR